jgi:hypothetical protein
MKTTGRKNHRTEAGYALLVTMGFLGIMLILMASVMSWTSNESRLTSRNNLYNSSVAAAEASTEMVIAQMDRDFLFQSVSTDLSQYQNTTPNALQAGWPIQFQFSDGASNLNQTGVQSLGPATVANLNSQFKGLYGLVMPYRITSQAQTANQLYSVSAAVSQDIQLASIPVFQFAIFYTLDLEINPGPQMLITGKVHSNGSIYTAPQTGLEYKDDVTASGQIITNREINDPQYGSAYVNPVWDSQHVDKVGAMTLPVGTNNSPASVQQILLPPPVGESANSELGQQRYYNKADIIINTTATNVQVLSGAWNGFAPIPPDITNASGPAYSFINTTPSFTDYREGKPTLTTEVDVGALSSWIQNPSKGGSLNNAALARMTHQLNSIYVNDQRSAAGYLAAVRVVNGAVLPPDGLTVSTPDPLYVKGNFNLNNGDTTAGQTDTSMTKPASLVGDAITILSQNWSDSGSSSLGGRQAVNTTVNAALITGIVETTKVSGTKYYSGGVENLPRFLEDWSNQTLTYNGSMVVMFDSQRATSFWKTPGNYYNPPVRKWAFDVNYLNQAKLPPGTPQVRKLVRGQWNIVAASN